MNKHLRKILAAMMALAMLLSALPVAALAEAIAEKEEPAAEEVMVVSDPTEEPEEEAPAA